MTLKLENDLSALFEAQTRSLGLGTRPPIGGPVVIPLAGRRSTLRPLAIAAALLIVIGGAGVWWALGIRQGATPADETDTVLMPTEPPLFELRAPGWTISSYNGAEPASAGEGSTTFVVAAEGLQGPRIDAYLSDGGSMPINDAEPDQITLAGAPASLLVDGDKAQVRWDVPDGHTLEAIGWNVDVGDLVAVAAAIDVVNGAPTATRPLPGGFVPITGREAELLRTFYEYQWVDDSGLQLQLSLYGGGKPVYDERVASMSNATEERTVTFQDAEAYVARTDTLIRLDQVHGFWLIEISGYPQTLADPDTGELRQAEAQFGSIDQFLQIADQLVTVDDVTWRASLPADLVLADELPSTLRELGVFALPDGGTVTSIPDDVVTSGRSAIAQAVAAETTCAWTSVMLDAADAGDAEAAIAASEVIHDIAKWIELATIPDTIDGTDALTQTGRIRRLDLALAPLRDLDPDNPDSDLAELGIRTAVDEVQQQPGIGLDCPSN